MSSLMDFLGQIEKLAYSLAIWVILIPKTIVKIILDPGWVREYVAKEFKESAEAKDEKSADKVRFDDYVSPVILLLLCSLVPYLYFQFLPDFGFAMIGGEDIQGPASCTVGSPCTYKVRGSFLGDPATDYQVEWQCRQYEYTDSTPITGTPFKDPSYPLASQVTCPWSEAGTMYVYAAVKTNSDRLVQWTVRTVDVQASSSAEPAPADDQQAPSSENVDTEKAISQVSKAKDVADAVKQNSYLGVFFLLPALAFALAVRGVRSKDGKKFELSGESLKEVFYAQCYYFTPFSLATYALLYGAYFSTTEDWVTVILLAGVFIGACVWFYKAEVTAVQQERGFEARRSARRIVNWTLVTMGAVSFVGLILFVFPEALRHDTYVLLRYGISLAVLYYLVGNRIVNWWNNRKNKKEAVSAEV